MTSVRTFVGVPLPSQLTSALMEARSAIVGEQATWRGEKWVAPENLHITVKFIGDVEDVDLDALGQAIQDAAAGHAPFDVTRSHVRAMPDARHATMLWLTFLDPQGLLGALAGDVEAATLQFGAAPDPRTFLPHATLVRSRARKPIGGRALAAAEAALSTAETSVSVHSVTLFSSHLTPRGPVYTALRECPLGTV